MSEKYLDKIAKLLTQAERASTPEEAEVFMAKAQQIATATQIDLAVARARTAKQERRAVPTTKSVHLGQRGTKLLHTYVALFTAIANANDVKVDIAHDSTYVYPFGFEDDIEVVERLYASLVVQMVEASSAYLRSGEYKRETVTTDVYRRGIRMSTKTKPVDGRVARRSFQQAFAYKIGQRLRDARSKAVQEAEEAEVAALTEEERRNREENGQTQTGTALALVEKSVEVHDFYKAKSRAKGTYRGGSGSSGYSSHAAGAGREAGSRARLGGERAIGGR